MTRFALRRRVAQATLALLPSLAFAHPGHDGDHGLTWDFSGELVHVLTSPVHLLPIAAAAAATVWFIRRQRQARRSRAARRTDV